MNGQCWKWKVSQSVSQSSLRVFNITVSSPGNYQPFVRSINQSVSLSVSPSIHQSVSFFLAGSRFVRHTHSKNEKGSCYLFLSCDLTESDRLDWLTVRLSSGVCWTYLSLSVCQSVHQSFCPSVRQWPSVYLSVHPSEHPSVHVFVCPFVYQSVRSFVYPSICPSIHLSASWMVVEFLSVRHSVSQSISLSVSK